MTAGYICPEPRAEFYAHLDAANVDLKGFTEDFYRHTCGAELGAVLDTLEYLRHETDVWFELTTLLIPGLNDSDAELDAMTTWVVEHLGPDVPDALHRLPPRLPDARPSARRRRRRSAGPDASPSATACATPTRATSATATARAPTATAAAPGSSTATGTTIGDYRLDDTGHCRACGTRIPGVFDGPAGGWGATRRPVRLVGRPSADGDR